VVNGGRWQGLKDADNEEEAYFNGVGEEDEELEFSAKAKPSINGASPIKPLVDYPDDDDDGTMDILAQDTSSDQPRETIEPVLKEQELAPVPERLAEKRRREEDEEDELTKLSAQPKRRSSSISSIGSAPSTHGQTLRRKKSTSISSGKDGPPKKISISLAVKSGNAHTESE
jgi:protein phosphatase-4 regulatory subunit 3